MNVFPWCLYIHRIQFPVSNIGVVLAKGGKPVLHVDESFDENETSRVMVLQKGPWILYEQAKTYEEFEEGCNERPTNGDR